MSSTRLAVLLAFSVCLLVGADAKGCGGSTDPTATCAAGNELSCISPELLNGGQCCVVPENLSATVGYACAYGADQSGAGCYATLDDANKACYKTGHPTPSGIVRCTK